MSRWAAMVVCVIALGGCGPNNNGTDSGGSDAGVVDGPVDISGTFAVVNRLAVFVETPTTPIVPVQILESLQFTRTTYAQNGTMLDEETMLCSVTLPQARIFNAMTGARVGLRFGDELDAYLRDGNITVDASGSFLSAAEIVGGTPIDYTPDRVVFLLGVGFDATVDPETAPLPTMVAMDDMMGGEIITINEPPGVYWEDTEGDVCPGFVVEGMSAGDPCPGVTVLPDGDMAALDALSDLLPDTVQLSFRVAVTLTGQVFSSDRLAGTIVNPLNEQEIIGFTLAPGGLAITAATVQANTPTVEVCTDQPACVDAGATSTWVGVRVDGTNGSPDADSDGDGTISCQEIIDFVDANLGLFGL